MAVWVVDYFLGISVEWIPFPLLSILSFFGSTYLSTAAFLTAVALEYYYLPVHLYAATANVSLIISSVVIIRLLTLDDSASFSTWIKEIPLQDYLVTGLILYLDFFWRTRPERFAILAAMSAISGIFLLLSLALNKVIGLEPAESSDEQDSSAPSTPDEQTTGTQETEVNNDSSTERRKKDKKQCANCGATEIKLRVCSGCNSVWYCSTECQKQHRPTHRQDCAN